MPDQSSSGARFTAGPWTVEEYGDEDCPNRRGTVVFDEARTAISKALSGQKEGK